MVLRVDKKSKGPAYLHLCYAGLALAMFMIICPCLLLTMFLMKAPWDYLKATQALYTIVVGLYVFHVMLDLAFIIWGKSDQTKLRTVLALACPAACVLLTLPTAGMLIYTKNQGGFSSASANAALAFSILLPPLLLLHTALVVFLYKTRHQKKSYLGICCQCLVDNNPEDTSQLPSSVEHGDVIVDTSIVPERLDQFEAVVFHAGQPRSANPAAPSDGGSDLDSYVVIPTPIPPPPPVPKRNNLTPQTSEGEKDLHDLQNEQTKPTTSSNELEGGKGIITPTPEASLDDISIEERDIKSDEAFQSMHEIDYPTSKFDQDPTKVTNVT